MSSRCLTLPLLTFWSAQLYSINFGLNSIVEVEVESWFNYFLFSLKVARSAHFVLKLLQTGSITSMVW